MLFFFFIFSILIFGYLNIIFYSKNHNQIFIPKNIFQKIIIYLLSIILFLLVYLNFPNKILYKHLYPEETITIQANPFYEIGQSSEVWLASVSIDGKLFPLNELHNHNWTSKDGILFTNNIDQNNTLSITINFYENIDFTFISHKWSGYVFIKSNDSNQNINLKSNEGKTIQLSVNHNNSNRYIFLKIIEKINTVLICVLIIQTILSFCLQISKKKQFLLTFKNKRIFLLLFIINIIYFSLFLLAYYPGILTIDSFSQWLQYQNKNIIDAHPAIHTIFSGLIANLTNPPLPINIVIAQILFSSFNHAFSVYLIYLISNKSKKVLLISQFFYFLPIFGFFTITLWKDIFYSEALLLLTLLLIFLKPTKPINKPICFFTIFSLLIIFTFRHNGVYIFYILTTLLVINCFKNKNLKLGYLFLLVLILFPIFKNYIFKIYSVSFPQINNIHINTIITQHLTPISIKNENCKDLSIQEYLINLYKNPDINNSYYAYSINNISAGMKKNGVEISNIEGLEKPFIKCLFSKPGVIFESFLKLTSFAWQISEPPNAFTYTVPNINKEQEVLLFLPREYYTLFKTTPKSVLLNNFINNIYNISLKNNITKSLFWRPGIYTIIIIIIATFLVSNNNGLMLILPSILNIFIVWLTSPSQDVRYLYSSFLVTPFLLAIFHFYKK